MGGSPVTLAITGASGALYALRTALALLEAEKPLEIVISPMGRYVLTEELGMRGGFAEFLAEKLGRDLDEGSLIEYGHDRLDAPPASGSHRTAGMAVVPCSMKTLAAVASGLSRTLIERAADVALKERRPLVLVPRESPMSLIHLRNASAAAEAGAAIVPASPAFYQRPRSFDDLADFIAGRVLSMLGIEHRLFPPWGRDDDQTA